MIQPSLGPWRGRDGYVTRVISGFPFVLFLLYFALNRSRPPFPLVQLPVRRIPGADANSTSTFRANQERLRAQHESALIQLAEVCFYFVVVLVARNLFVAGLNLAGGWCRPCLSLSSKYAVVPCAEFLCGAR